MLLLTVVVVMLILALSYEKTIANILLPQYISWAHEADIHGLEVGAPLQDQQLTLTTDISIHHPEII